MKHYYFLLLSAIADAFQKVEFADLAAPMFDITDYGMDVRKISLKQTKSNIVSAQTHALVAHSYHKQKASGSGSVKEKPSFVRPVSKRVLRLAVEEDKSSTTASSLEEMDRTPDVMEVMENQKNSEYVVHFYVGSTMEVIPVAPDSGSTNLWLVSELCPLPRCKELKQYHPSHSAHAKKLEKSEISVTFGTASLKGIEYSDDVGLGDIVLRDLHVGAITHLAGKVWDTIELGGILGLGFPALAHFGGVPFFDRLMEEKMLRANQFTFFVSPWGRDEYSALLLGKVDDNLYEGELSCFPVAAELERFWIVNVNKVTLRYKDNRKPEIEFDGPKRIIFDSGTNLYSVDNKQDLIEFLPRIDGEDKTLFDRELYNILHHAPPRSRKEEGGPLSRIHGYTQ
eukprot:GEMP01031598.1.p1 GENE.GEMP01031598.1~~GEMP01031598.1.p1  ORF type:complete len:397 (+),score=55.98 GEMP01031598.1:172-1362(+)